MTLPPGSAGSLVDVPGIAVGHATDREARTGCTVVLCQDGAVSGLDVRGTHLGSNETDLARGGFLVQRVNAVVLAGGSSFGLSAVEGVMRYLEQRGQGYLIRQDLPKADAAAAASAPIVVPIVAASTIFDLDVARGRPDAEAGYLACEAARTDGVEEGCVGVGAGALAGKALGAGSASPGGVGTASRGIGDYTLGVLAVVNCFGCVVDRESGQPLAGPRAADGRLVCSADDLLERAASVQPSLANLAAVLATDCPLDREQANVLASTAYDGFRRTVVPTDPSLDSSAVFVLSTHPGPTGRQSAAVLARLGTVAADLMATAVTRAVRIAAGPGDRV